MAHDRSRPDPKHQRRRQRTSTRSRPPSGSRRSTPSSSTTARPRPPDPRRASSSARSTPARGPIASLNTPYVNTIPADARGRRSRAIPRSSGGCARSSAGTRWRWSCAPTSCPPSSAATSRPSSRWRRCTRSASTTSGTRRPRTHGGDLVYFQGHSSPGNYARAFLEGRLTAEQLDGFRQEVSRPGGLSLLPAPVADARLLAVPDGVARDRRDHLDLPGAVHEVPARRAGSTDTDGSQGVGVPRRRRDGRARDDGRDRRSPAASSSTT